MEDKDKLVFIGTIVGYVWYSLFYVRIRTKKDLRESGRDLHPGIIFRKNVFWDVIITAFLLLLLYGSFITLNNKYSFKADNSTSFFIVVLIMFIIILISTIYHLCNFDHYRKKN